ncbi:MAG: hypothetical protein HFH08_00320 [Bacilli bacterium]|nr:hypothetical protein [Bacilli bacterium]
MLEKIVETYLKSHSPLKELKLIEDFAFIFVNNRYNLNIDFYPFKDYIIKSDTLNYVHDFLASIDPKYAEEFDYALKCNKILFIQTKKKKKEIHEYEVIASYSLKDSFDLIRVFFKYWMNKNGVLKKENDYFIDTFVILAEFLFQDYLESLKYKNREPYYQKMNRFISTNVFTVHMIMELKLIELYQQKKPLSLNTFISELKVHNISNEEMLPKNCQIMMDDILSIGSLSIPFHKRYLYSMILASYIHGQILKEPKLIYSFCYLIDFPENIKIEEFLKAIGISVRMKDEKLVLSKVGYQKLRKSFLAELEDCFIRANIEF